MDYARAGPDWRHRPDEADEEGKGSNRDGTRADEQRALVAAALNGQLEPELLLVPLLSFPRRWAQRACVPSGDGVRARLAPGTTIRGRQQARAWVRAGRRAVAVAVREARAATGEAGDREALPCGGRGRHKLSVLQIRPMGAIHTTRQQVQPPAVGTVRVHRVEARPRPRPVRRHPRRGVRQADRLGGWSRRTGLRTRCLRRSRS